MPVPRHNATFHEDAIAALLEADLETEETTLTLWGGDPEDDADGQELIVWHGVLDVEDARARLHQTLGALAGYVPLTVDGNGDYR